jgi:hypothetical protein
VEEPETLVAVEAVPPNLLHMRMGKAHCRNIKGAAGCDSWNVEPIGSEKLIGIFGDSNHLQSRGLDYSHGGRYITAVVK